jgi:hypothetical protein
LCERERVLAAKEGNRGETLQKIQTATTSEIINQSERFTHQLKALPTHNHIMYITSHYLIHLVHDMQDLDIRQKSKIEIMEVCGFQQTIMCLPGTSK